MKPVLAVMWAATAVLAASGWACSPAPASPSGTTSSLGSCSAETSRGRSCIDYVQGFTLEQGQSGCSQLHGTYAAGQCPTDNRVGRCTVTTNGGGVVIVSTLNAYGPTWTTSDAQARCLAAGSGDTTTTFTPN